MTPYSKKNIKMGSVKHHSVNCPAPGARDNNQLIKLNLPGPTIKNTLYYLWNDGWY
jgi:hypothetical protein